MPEVRDTNWGDLMWQQFQGLVNRLLYLHSVYGLGNIKGRLIRPFEAAGPDGGVDGRFEGEVEGTDGIWAVQAKSGMHSLKPSDIKRRLSAPVIRKWVAKVKQQGFTGGILVCDGKVNQATALEIERRIRSAGMEPKFWHSGVLNNMVAATPEALVHDLSMLLSLDEYQRTMLGPNAERYDIMPIGRDSEAQTIAEFLADDSKRVLFVRGPKCSGRTHVLVTALRRVWDTRSPADSGFPEVRLWPVFLNPRVFAFGDPSRDVGDRHPCVFVVDGVEQFVGKPLYGDFVTWFLSCQGAAAYSKLIVCLRSSAEDAARQPFLADSQSRSAERVECRVGPLNDRDFEALVERLGLNTRHVVPLARLTGRLPGWLDAVRELVATGRSVTELKAEDLTRGVLDEVVHVLKNASPEPERALVWLALNEPVADAEVTHERLAQGVGTTVSEASRVFAFLDRSGYLQRFNAGFGQTVVSIRPDAVAQAALAMAARDDKQFLMDLVMQSLPTNGGNILRNLAMAEASPSEEATASVLDSVLKTLEDAVVDMPNADRWTVTAQLTNIAWVRPRQVLGIAEAVVENPLPPDNLGDATAALALIDHKWAVHGMPVVLKAVVRATPDRDVRNRALDILLDLWRVDPDRRGWADSPGEVMDHVFTPTPGIPLSFYVELFNWVEAKSSDPSDAPLLVKCARALLALEGFTSWGRLGGSIDIVRWRAGSAASEAGLKALRHRVLAWLFSLLGSSGVTEMRIVYDALDAAASGAVRNRDGSEYDGASDLRLIASHLKARAQHADAVEQDLILSLVQKPPPWSIFPRRFAGEVIRLFRSDPNDKLYRLLMGRAESAQLLLDRASREVTEKRLTRRLRKASVILLKGGPRKAFARIVTMVQDSDAFSMNLASCLWWAGTDRVRGATALCRLALDRLESGAISESPYVWYIGQLLGGLFESGGPHARRIMRSAAQSGSLGAAQVTIEAFTSLRRAGIARLTRRDLDLAATALRVVFDSGRLNEVVFRCLRPFQGKCGDEVHGLALQLSGLVGSDAFHTYVSALVLLLLDLGERTFSVLRDDELAQLTARLTDVPEIKDYWLGQLMREAAERDFARWLGIVHARLCKHGELLDARHYGGYRPLPFHLSHCLPAALADDDVKLGLASVQDWLPELYPGDSLMDTCHMLSQVFHEIDSRCATRGSSGLSVPAEERLSDWMASSLSEGKGNLQGAKLWGIGILLRDFDFTPQLLEFLEPLIEMGDRPRRDRDTVGNRIWRELYRAVGPSRVYSPSTEYYEAKAAGYEAASKMAGLKLRRFLEPLIAEARQKAESYRYPHFEFG